jgi:hypothetical protein
VNVGWCERHCLPPWSLDRKPISKCKGSDQALNVTGAHPVTPDPAVA